VDARPTNTPQPEDVSAKQQILDGRRAVLEQITELMVVRYLQVTTDHDTQSGAPSICP